MSAAKAQIRMRNHPTLLLKVTCRCATITPIYTMNKKLGRETICLTSSTITQTIFGRTYIFTISKWSKSCSSISETFFNNNCLILTISNNSSRTIFSLLFINRNHTIYLNNIPTIINGNRFKVAAIQQSTRCNSNNINFWIINNSLNLFIMVSNLPRWPTTVVSTSQNRWVTSSTSQWQIKAYSLRQLLSLLLLRNNSDYKTKDRIQSFT